VTRRLWSFRSQLSRECGCLMRRRGSGRDARGFVVFRIGDFKGLHNNSVGPCVWDVVEVMKNMFGYFAVTWWRRSVHHRLVGPHRFQPLTTSFKAGKGPNATISCPHWNMCLDSTASATAMMSLGLVTGLGRSFPLERSPASARSRGIANWVLGG